MKTAIIAFDALRNPTRSFSKTGGDVRKEYNRMRAEKESLNGLPVVELWTEDRGFEARYFATDKPKSEIKTKGSSVKKLVGLFVAIIVLIGLASNAQAKAQYGSPSATLPPTVAAATATNLATAPVMDLRKSTSVALQTAFTLSATATTNTIYTFAFSVDGVNYDTTGTWTWTVPQNGTTKVIASTNVNCGGYGYLKLISIDNRDDNGILTNNVFKWSIKHGVD